MALRSRDVEFAGAYVRVSASYTQGLLTTPKSGKVRSVPMAPEVGAALARLNEARPHATDDVLVFERVPGSFLDASALLRRYKQALKRAGLRPLRFHEGGRGQRSVVATRRRAGGAPHGSYGL